MSLVNLDNLVALRARWVNKNTVYFLLTVVFILFLVVCVCVLNNWAVQLYNGLSTEIPNPTNEHVGTMHTNLTSNVSHSRLSFCNLILIMVSEPEIIGLLIPMLHF